MVKVISHRDFNRIKVKNHSIVREFMLLQLKTGLFGSPVHPFKNRCTI
jgi:hypothetical protein